MDKTLVRQQFEAHVEAELTRARAKHPQPFNSDPEAWAVISEELDEFRDAYRERHGGDITPTIKELIETAAMCRRAYEDLYSYFGGPRQAPEFRGGGAPGVPQPGDPLGDFAPEFRGGAAGGGKAEGLRSQYELGRRLIQRRHNYTMRRLDEIQAGPQFIDETVLELAELISRLCPADSDFATLLAALDLVRALTNEWASFAPHVERMRGDILRVLNEREQARRRG